MVVGSLWFYSVITYNVILGLSEFWVFHMCWDDGTVLHWHFRLKACSMFDICRCPALTLMVTFNQFYFLKLLLVTRLRWFGDIERRPVDSDSVARRVDQKEGSQITRGRGRPRKTIRKTMKKIYRVMSLIEIRYMIEHYGVVWSMQLTPLSGIRLGCCCCCWIQWGREVYSHMRQFTMFVGSLWFYWIITYNIIYGFWIWRVSHLLGWWNYVPLIHWTEAVLVSYTSLAHVVIFNHFPFFKLLLVSTRFN